MSGGSGRGFFEAIGICFSKYATFKGRAPRSEYWWWVLFQLVIGAVFESILLPPLLRDFEQTRATGVIPPQDYDFLYQAGVAGIYGPGTVIPVAAQKIVAMLCASVTA